MFRRMLCHVWGHAVDNRVYRYHRRACSRCARECLGDDNGVVRVGHTLSCFLRHHTYERVGVRDGHAEYACVRCGHPLLFALGADPYDASARFDKRVRYLCGRFGHHVHGGVAQRRDRVRMSLRTHVRPASRRRIGHSSSAGLLLPRPLDQICGRAAWVQRIRMPQLWTSVSVHGATPAGISRCRVM